MHWFPHQNCCLCAVFFVLIRASGKAGSTPNEAVQKTPEKEAAYDWMWLLGENVGNQGTFLERDKNSDELNETPEKPITTSYPGAREGATFWMDREGTGFMFGGKGFGETDSEQGSVLQDLWQFSVLQKKWLPLNVGTDTTDQQPGMRHRAAGCGVHKLVFVVFGGENEKRNVKNDTWIFDLPRKMWYPLLLSQEKGPPSRKDAACWCDRGKIVLFGGETENNRVLDDMWEFSFKTFKWMEVKPTGKALPLGRNGAVTWSDHSGNLFLYGGQRIEPEEHGAKVTLLSDLWLFNAKEKTWSLFHGDASANTKSASYGAQRIGGSLNSPGPRMHSAAWRIGDSLWLYGGVGCGKAESKCQTFALHADLWKFKRSTSQWVWQGGSKELDISPSYGRKGHSDPQNCPGSRMGGVGWSYQGVAFMFGGLGKDGRHRTSFLNDLWLLGKANVTYTLSSTSNAWLRRIHPGIIFAIVLASIGGVVVLFGAIFFLKKMYEYSRHRVYTGDFKVRYSPVSQEATLET